jgi:hypothetical protein
MNIQTPELKSLKSINLTLKSTSKIIKPVILTLTKNKNHLHIQQKMLKNMKKFKTKIWRAQ